MQINEGRLVFDFSAALHVVKYDDWSFYRNQFGNAFGGAKAVDFVCIDNDMIWLVEVKDYRDERRTKTMDLGDEVAAKIRDSLAGLIAAAANANEPQERSFAADVLSKRKIRIVLHLEQPIKPSRLFPKVVEPGNLRLKLRQLLKAVDPHPYVVDRYSLTPNMKWHVQ